MRYATPSGRERVERLAGRSAGIQEHAIWWRRMMCDVLLTKMMFTQLYWEYALMVQHDFIIVRVRMKQLQ
eukprot:192252-Hanusia_phi.AAC.1